MLWLDDLKPFLNQVVTLQTLREWHASRPGRIVATTYGGKGSEQIADAVTLLPLTLTSAAELGALGGQLNNAQLQAIGPFPGAN